MARGPITARVSSEREDVSCANALTARKDARIVTEPRSLHDRCRRRVSLTREMESIGQFSVQCCAWQRPRVFGRLQKRCEQLRRTAYDEPGFHNERFWFANDAFDILDEYLGSLF